MLVVTDATVVLCISSFHRISDSYVLKNVLLVTGLTHNNTEGDRMGRGEEGKEKVGKEGKQNGRVIAPL